MKWQEQAAAEKARIDGSIPAEWRLDIGNQTASPMDLPATSGLLNDRELDITESSAVELVGKMGNGTLTSVEVTIAFCKRAALAQQLTNCFHDFFPDQAIAQAQDLDDYFAKHKKPSGPLHGLPVSLKDQCRIKGRQTHMGYVAWLGNTDIEDSVLVHLLRQAGAVFYVKTSVPQSLMVCETVNNITGRTLNPRNKDWSCGGSSGGEGAIVGFRGAVIGVGTDIGGSIRVPSAFNFLYGLRPSHGRLPYAKMANSMEGQETIHSVCGPLAHSVADIRLFVTSVLEQQPWAHDSKVIPMPWRRDLEEQLRSKISAGKLTVGYYDCDNVVLPHPPVRRGVKLAVDALRQAGHNVYSWEPYKHPVAVKMANRVYAADGGTDINQALERSGEPMIPNVADLVNPNLPKADINQAWDLQLEKWKYQCEYLNAIRKFEQEHGRELDAIIAPVAATAAIRHNQFKYYGYATAINILDFTSVVVPVTFADQEVDLVDDSFTALSDTDAAVHAEYDPKAYHGAPVAVQIIGRRLTEEQLLVIAEEVGRLLGNA